MEKNEYTFPKNVPYLLNNFRVHIYIYEFIAEYKHLAITSMFIVLASAMS